MKAPMGAGGGDDGSLYGKRLFGYSLKHFSTS